MASLVEDNKNLPIFHDAFLKADWAEHCTKSLSNSFDWYTKNGMRMTVKARSVGSRNREVIMETAPLIPLGLEVGDIIRNLRGALDAAVSAVYRAHGKKENDAYWPIAGFKHDLEANIDRHLRRAGFEDLCKFFLTEMECTKSGNFALWKMHEIDRANKHRSISVVVVWAVMSDPSYFLPDSIIYFNNKTFLHPGTTRSLFIPVDAVTEGFESPQPTLSVTFGPSEVFSGEFVIPKLNDLHKEVTDALLKFQSAYVAAYHTT